MIYFVGRILVASGLVSLALAGLFLVVGHNPNAYVLNQQAETMANFAYGLIAAGLIAQIINSPKE